MRATGRETLRTIWHCAFQGHPSTNRAPTPAPDHGRIPFACQLTVQHRHRVRADATSRAKPDWVRCRYLSTSTESNGPSGG